MKSKLLMAVMASVLLASAASAQRGGYYASKADERAGRLTPGSAPVPPSVTNAGGDTCAAATVIPNGAGNFTDSGTTIGANNTVTTLPAGCSDYTAVAGPDVIYTFTLGALANRGTPLTITVTPTGATGYDTSIYTLSTAGVGCPAGTANVITTNCVNGADAGSFGAPETITDAETDAMAAGTYFLFVDSFYSTGSAGQPNRLAGPYDLVVGARPLPVELLDFSID
jgi:hypothetical protein